MSPRTQCARHFQVAPRLLVGRLQARTATTGLARQARMVTMAPLFLGGGDLLVDRGGDRAAVAHRRVTLGTDHREGGQGQVVGRQGQVADRATMKLTCGNSKAAPRAAHLVAAIVTGTGTGTAIEVARHRAMTTAVG